MTEFSEIVEAKRAELLLDKRVREWSKQVKYLLAENGYIKTAYNNGKVEVIYHRDYGDHLAGDVITEFSGMTPDEVRMRFTREMVDQGKY